jgi:hypothetical protein
LYQSGVGGLDRFKLFVKEPHGGILRHLLIQFPLERYEESIDPCLERAHVALDALNSPLAGTSFLQELRKLLPCLE